jgi:hypothetical protein
MQLAGMPRRELIRLQKAALITAGRSAPIDRIWINTLGSLLVPDVIGTAVLSMVITYHSGLPVY